MFKTKITKFKKYIQETFAIQNNGDTVYTRNVSITVYRNIWIPNDPKKFKLKKWNNEIIQNISPYNSLPKHNPLH